MRFVILFIFCSALMAHAQYGSKGRIYKAFELQEQSLKPMISLYKNYNDRLYYESFGAENLNPDKIKTLDSLKLFSNGLESYINKLKTLIILKTEALKTDEVINIDSILGIDTTLSIADLKYKDDYITPTEILIGSASYRPKTGQFTATELADSLVQFNNFIDRTIVSLNKSYEKDSYTTGTELLKNVQNSNFWIKENFYNLPLASVINQLDLIRLNIKLVESNLLNYILKN